jgi:hypothetical protein
MEYNGFKFKKLQKPKRSKNIYLGLDYFARIQFLPRCIAQTW